MGVFGSLLPGGETGQGEFPSELPRSAHALWLKNTAGNAASFFLQLYSMHVDDFIIMQHNN